MRNFISPIISEKKPDFLKREYKAFGRFIDHFYSFLETEGNPLEVLENFYERFEPNNQIDGYIDKILFECGFDIQNTLSIPKKELILHLRDFYLSRGSEASFKFLFRILYNCDVSIDYPRKRMLIPSQATYSGRYFVFTTTHHIGTSDFDSILNLANDYDLILRGVSSKTECSVEGISILHRLNYTYLKIQIDAPYRKFQKGEGIEIVSLSTGVKVIENFVDTVDLEITNPGKGYAIGDKIFISNTNVVGNARVKTLKEGSVSGVTINSGGSGYAVGDQIFSEARLKGHSFSASVSKVDNSDNFLEIPFSSGLDLTTGDFSIETWVFMPVAIDDSIIATGKHSSLDRGWTLKISGDKKLVFMMYGSTVYTVKSVRSVQSNRWVHIAASRDGNTLRLFVDGILTASDTIASGITASSNIRIGIGIDGKSAFVGYLDDFRITKGVPRYTSSFAIPNGEFDSLDPLFASVSLLIHFNGMPGSSSFVDSSTSPNTITAHGSIYIDDRVIRFTNTSGYFSGLGSISKIAIFNQGYGYDSTPNLVIKSDRGTGASLSAESNNIGQIESVEILDPFADSFNTMSTSIASNTGSGAIISASSGSVFSEKPSWKSLEGALGINSTLLDSSYYQQFSYTVYSPITRNEYDALANEWVHPSGFVRFSILDITYSGALNPLGQLVDNFYLSLVKVIDGFVNVYLINFDSNGYDSGAPEVTPITKYYTIRDSSMLINSQSWLNWFKESTDNFWFTVNEWDNFTVGDPPLETNDAALLSRKKVNDNSIMMNQTLDAQIDIITI